MPNFSELQQSAVKLHLEGQIDRARRIYDEILQKDPRHVEALSLRGLVAWQTGQFAEAVEYLRQAIALEGSKAAFHANLGEAYRGLGQITEAIACYREAVRLQPNASAPHLNLGKLLQQSGSPAEAITYYERALQLDPHGDEAHYLLGTILQQQEQLQQASEHYRKAVELKPDHLAAWIQLGNLLREQKQVEEALVCFQRAVELRPDAPEPVNNLGTILHDLGRLNEAQQCFAKALELEPDKAEVYFNLGMALVDRNQALDYFEQALRINPHYPQALASRGMAWLSLGDFQQGWAGYEHRIDCPHFDTTRFSKPQWDGSPLENRTLLIHCEQGLGDTLQFIRYIPLAQQRGKKIIVAAQPAIVPLLAQSGFTGLIRKGQAFPSFDVHAPLLSLPFIFRTRLDAIPGGVPYLKAEPSKVDLWRGKLEKYAGLKIGIAWQGRVEYCFDRLRSIALEHFAPLAQPGVRLLSLQKGPGTEQLAGLNGRFEVIDLSPAIDHEGAFLDTAAVIKNLDLVVTSDTAIAHLAGALGVRVWLALSAAPDWRWLHERDDSPWYPTMRLFRQTEVGRWSEVFEGMAKALKEIRPAA